MSDDLKHMLRAMAWERAKGELNSILQTYYDEGGEHLAMSNAIAQFVELVELNGWQE